MTKIKIFEQMANKDFTKTNERFRVDDGTKKFYENLNEWAAVPPEDWNHVNILAYFCRKYQSKHKLRFRLAKSKGGPIKSKESRDFSKLFKLLASEEYSSMNKEDKRNERIRVNWMIYNYINWMFDYKFRRGNNSINSTSIFLNNSFLNEFERAYAKKLRQAQGKSDIETLISWAEKNSPEVLDLHQIESPADLKMVKNYYSSFNLNSDSNEYKFILKAKELGLI